MSFEHMPVRCVVLGGGNHAKVVIEALEVGGRVKPCVVLDVDPTRWGQSLHGVPILGDDSHLARLVDRGITHFVVGVGSSSDTRARQSLFALAREFGLEPMLVQHPTAIVSPTAVMGDGVQMLAGSIVSSDCVVGTNVIVNTGAIAEHDCIIEDHVHLATGARLAGGVVIQSGAHIGIGATILQGIKIGGGAVVGAGAVVVRDVAAGVVVAGVPARELRRVAA